CMYIIGELCKRLGLYEESTQWLSRLIMSYSDPQQKEIKSQLNTISAKVENQDLQITVLKGSKKAAN
ncbi:MAG: DUF2225 domain-containing protein, partial [Clostridiaceae bacterium]|nr:DUF2225 domain-containing protein [Clostridiaceae bacterium]